jgi:hypothetical protein
MHEVVYGELKRLAKTQSTATYGQIAHLAGLELDDLVQRNRLSEMLGEISTHEFRQGRPMLSAVVISSEEGMPGIGFFNLARALGKHKSADDLAFFVGELGRVYAAWKEL